ncbi:MAG: endonuclease [Anaerolineae bacterium]|nr:endonuclease [Anaerolineae bacterium]
MPRKTNVYAQLVEEVFAQRYKVGSAEVPFDREDIESAARKLGMQLPKNLGDVVYSFRYRTSLPETIREKAPDGYEWIIRPAGRGHYKFALVAKARIIPSSMLAETKILDSTPGVITRYAFTDEQALLAKLRYNRLIDIFTGLTCYSLQNHLRTTVPGMGQVETDEIYIGVDSRGAQYVLPVQAKGRTEQIGVVQIEQDFAVCATKFPQLICRPVASQLMDNQLIALFELEQSERGVRIVAERHYRLVSPEDLSPEELEAYRRRPTQPDVL